MNRCFWVPSGDALYAGGLFTSAGGAAADRVARWDGTTWAALGGGVNDLVSVRDAEPLRVLEVVLEVVFDVVAPAEASAGSLPRGA